MKRVAAQFRKKAIKTGELERKKRKELREKKLAPGAVPPAGVEKQRPINSTGAGDEPKNSHQKRPPEHRVKIFKRERRKRAECRRRLLGTSQEQAINSSRPGEFALSSGTIYSIHAHR